MENILSINLETSTAPIVQEVRGRDYIEYGTEDWRNLYPQFLIDLYYNSSTHAAIVNQTAEMIAGTDLIAEEEDAINLETCSSVTMNITQVPTVSLGVEVLPLETPANIVAMVFLLFLIMGFAFATFKGGKK